ncbi:hypothetical protein BGZ76_005910 [Entomortierella beljakovae]|nr:hypothetical protein BGZ76_005910 [Entomortierella beljakovae]
MASPPPPPKQKQKEPQKPAFRMPVVPEARSRPNRPIASSSAGETSAAASSRNLNVYGASNEWPQQDANNGLIYYQKPVISASQVPPTQPTQLVDMGYDPEPEENDVVAYLYGHGTTMGTELTRDKHVYEFGTIVENPKVDHRGCDVIINHLHWRSISLEISRPEIWFVIVSDEEYTNTSSNIIARMNEIQEDVDVIHAEKETYYMESNHFATGNYALVFRAKGSDDKLYACKVINRLKRPLSDEEIENIEFELALLSTVNHGNYFSEVDARSIFQQLCEAINYLHEHNIVHRDIKSENIMITDNELKVKLIDFGLARRTDSSMALTTRCGTPTYMAPEVALGDEINGYGKPVGLYPFLASSYNYDLAGGEVNTTNSPSTNPPTSKNEGNETRNNTIGEDSSNIIANSFEDYQRNWDVLVNKKSIRSKMFCTDPTRRITIEHVLRHDWMTMIEEELHKFDLATASQDTEQLHETPEMSENENENEEEVVHEQWGELELLDGSMCDARRIIRLRKEHEWLGRDTKRVSIALGYSRLISKIQCVMFRKDGLVFVSSVVTKDGNGTYINNFKVENGTACQLLDGDEIGFVVPPENQESSARYAVSYRESLRYTVTIFGVPQTSDEDRVRRRIIDYTPSLPADVRRIKPIRTQVEAREEDAWAILYPLNDNTKKEILVAHSIRLGRDRNLTFEWMEDCKIANLIVHTRHNRTFVNDVKVRGTYQLRDKDIVVIKAVVVADPESKNLESLQWQLVRVASEDAIRPSLSTQSTQIISPGTPKSVKRSFTSPRGSLDDFQDSDSTFQVSAANDGTVVRLDKTLKTWYLIGSQNREDLENNIIWIDLGHVWKCVSVASVSQIWGLSDSGDIYYGASDRFVQLESPVTSGAGYNMPKFTQISVGRDNLVVATDAHTGTVFRLKTHPASSHPPVWAAVEGTGPGAAIHMTSCMASSADYIIGLSKEGKVFRRCNGNWIPISGQTKLNHIDVGVDGYVMGIDIEGNLHACQLQNSVAIPRRMSSRSRRNMEENLDDPNAPQSPDATTVPTAPRLPYLPMRAPTSSRELFEMESSGKTTSAGHSRTTSKEFIDSTIDGNHSSGYNTPARYTFGRTDSQLSKNSYAAEIGPLTPLSFSHQRGESISRSISNRITPVRIQSGRETPANASLQNPVDYISSKPLPGDDDILSTKKGGSSNLLSIVRGEITEEENMVSPLSDDKMTDNGSRNLKHEVLGDDRLNSTDGAFNGTQEGGSEAQEICEPKINRSRENSASSLSNNIKSFPQGEEPIAGLTTSMTVAQPHAIMTEPWQNVEKPSVKGQDNRRNRVSHDTGASEPDARLLAPGLMTHRPSDASEHLMQQQQEFLRQTRLRSGSLVHELSLDDLHTSGSNGHLIPTTTIGHETNGYPPLEDSPEKRNESIGGNPNSKGLNNSKTEVTDGQNQQHDSRNNSSDKKGQNNENANNNLINNNKFDGNGPYGSNPNNFGPNGNNPNGPYGANPNYRNIAHNNGPINNPYANYPNNVPNGSPNIGPYGNNGPYNNNQQANNGLYGNNPNIINGPNNRPNGPYGVNPNARNGPNGNNVNNNSNPNVNYNGPYSNNSYTNNNRPYGNNLNANNYRPYGNNPNVNNNGPYGNNNNNNSPLGANPGTGNGVYGNNPNNMNHGGPNRANGHYGSNPNIGGEAHNRSPYHSDTFVEPSFNSNSKNPYDSINGINAATQNNGGSKTELPSPRPRDSTMTTSTAYSLEPIGGNSGLVSRHGAYGATLANETEETLGRPSQQTLRAEARPSGEGNNSLAKPKAQFQGAVQGENAQGQWVGGTTTTNAPVQNFTPDVKKSKCCTIM